MTRRLLAAALLALAPPAPAQDATEPPPATLIRGATILPMGGLPRLEGHDVLIVADRIAGIAPAGTLTPPAGAAEIDAAGGFLIPGLCDMHIHTFSARDDDLALCHGVTTVRNMWGTPIHKARIERAQWDERPVPTMVTTSPLLDGSPPVWPRSDTADTAEEARARVEAYAAQGYTQLKVYSRLNREAFLAACAAAGEHAMTVVGHVPPSVSPEEAFAAGMGCVEHLTEYAWAALPEDHPLRVERDRLAGGDEEGRSRLWQLTWNGAWEEPFTEQGLARAVELTRRHGVWNVPTLTINRRIRARGTDATALRQHPQIPFVAPTQRAWWGLDKPAGEPGPEGDAAAASARAVADNQARLVRALYEGGCPLMTGSDAPNPFTFHGYTVHEEMWAMVDAGIPPLGALEAATSNPARFLAQEHEFGRIAPGLRADLALLEADPTADIRNTARIRAVMVKGRWLDRAWIDEKLAATAAAFAPEPAP